MNGNLFRLWNWFLKMKSKSEETNEWLSEQTFIFFSGFSFVVNFTYFHLGFRFFFSCFRFDFVIRTLSLFLFLFVFIWKLSEQIVFAFVTIAFRNELVVIACVEQRDETICLSFSAAREEGKKKKQRKWRKEIKTLNERRNEINWVAYFNAVRTNELAIYRKRFVFSLRFHFIRS